MHNVTPVLEIRNRKGHAALHAEGPTAIYAAVALGSFVGLV
jgi:hypothetical protein